MRKTYISTEKLALCLFTHYMTRDPLPAQYRQLFDDTERLAETDPALHRRIMDLTFRLEELAAALDPCAHFEALTARRHQPAYSWPHPSYVEAF